MNEYEKEIIKIEKEKIYINERDWYAKVAQECSDYFDKMIISIGIGSIWGSLLFATNIPTNIMISFLLTWRISIGIAITVSLISFMLSEKANRNLLDQIDKEKEIEKIKEEINNNNWKKNRELQINLGKERDKLTNLEKKGNILINFTKNIRIPWTILMILGIIFLVIFFYLNLNTKNTWINKGSSYKEYTIFIIK